MGDDACHHPATRSVDDVLITDQLTDRPSRPPDYAAENRALTTLAQEMAIHPERVLQKVAELALELCHADSAGISVLEPGGENGIFRWYAAAGAFAGNLNGTMARDASPCGTVIACNQVLLFNGAERFFPALRGVEPRIYENLLAPWMMNGAPAGTLWTIKHTPEGRFDTEDARLLASLARFASAAWHTVTALQSAKTGQQQLEERVQERTRNLIEAGEARSGSEARLAADLAGMRRLYDLHARLATETGLKTALDEILAAACEFTATDRGCVQLVSEDGERLEMFAWRGYADDSPFVDYYRYEGFKQVCDVTRVEQRRLIIEDVVGFPGLEDTEAGAALLADGIRASQSTPMVSRKGETVGVLSTQFRQPHCPTGDELRLVDLLAWTAADFVERHRAEKAMRLTRQRLERVLETDAVGVLFFDSSGTVVDANHVWLEMTGYTRGQLERRELTWRSMTPPEWVEESEKQMQQLAATGRIGPYEKEYVLADGSRRWMLFAGRDLGDGTVSEYCIDITPRKEAGDALREREEIFRLFVDNVKEYALLQTGPEGQVTSWNPGAERLFGYTTAEMIGKSAACLLTPEDQASGVLARELSRVLAGNRDEDARWLVRRDGSRFWARWVTEPVRDESGRLRGVAKVLRDETDRQRTEQAIRHSLAEKDALLKEVHHRVKNNLQVIASLLNLQAKQVEDARVLALFDATRNRVHSIAAIHELLCRSASFAEIRLADYARDLVVELVRFYGAGDRVRVDVEGDGAAVELERAVPYGLLLNELVSNACKHAFPLNRRGTLTISIRNDGSQVALTVADDGVGLPHGFNYQAAASLGLKLVHMLAAQLGGEARLVSAAGSHAGTHVEVRFPIAAPEEENA